MIPKIIHFCWHDPANLPEYARYNLQRFRELNPDYDVMLHGPDCLLPKYAKAAANAPEPDRTSDLWRYSILQTYGGWWFDLDYLPFRPVADIVRAYGLDGSKFFVTEQYHQKNPTLTTAAGVIGACVDSPVWSKIDAAIEAVDDPHTRTCYGPRLLTRLVNAEPDWFTVGRWPWFYPAGIESAKAAYRAIRNGEDPREVLKVAMVHSGDQLPFMMHLWMGGKTTVVASTAQKAALAEKPKKLRKYRVGVIAHNQQWKDRSLPFRAVVDGFKAIGCQAEVVVPDRWPVFATRPDVVIMWNGRHKSYRSILDGCQREGVRPFFMELGFFDRQAYTQIDHEGFNHTASWTGAFADPAPDQSRLGEVWREPIEPIASRDGYTLVLGQVYGDSQLYESETRDSLELYRAVASCGGDVRYRPHPKARRETPADVVQCGGSLREAIDGAAFVVTINSNSATEAVSWGCPVLSLGPSLAIDAGAARKATLATMADDIASMRGGWCPSQSSVDNYLHWLACRQWNRREIASGRPLEVLLEGMWL